MLTDSPTNSTGKIEHFFAIVTFLSGEDTTAFEIICWVLLNHHKLVSLSTWKNSAITIIQWQENNFVNECKIQNLETKQLKEEF